MALGSHLITVRRLEKYINDVIGKKANLPDTSKTIIGNISQINSDLADISNSLVHYRDITGQTDANGYLGISSYSGESIMCASPNGNVQIEGMYSNGTQLYIKTGQPSTSVSVRIYYIKLN